MGPRASTRAQSAGNKMATKAKDVPTMARNLNSRRIRKIFGNIHEISEMPNLIEVQRSSYEQFLQRETRAADRRDEGVEITAQNHGFAVDPASLRGAGFEETHVSLNDGTSEGMRHRELPVFSVQYHPEASPGPHDADYLFDRFVTLMEGGTASCRNT